MSSEASMAISSILATTSDNGLILKRENEDYLKNGCISWQSEQYDDVDILPSSSLFDESYPEFYGDQCLSQQFL